MMSFDDDRHEDSADLRHRAEEFLSDNERLSSGPPSHAEAIRLIHELQVHQVELELQQAELRASRDELELQRARFVDLYDFAPTGYLTLTSDGRITEVNLAGASMLGSKRARLVGQELRPFLATEDREPFTACLARIFGSGEREQLELTISGDGPNSRVARLDAVLGSGGDDCRNSLSDITARREAERALLLRDRAMQTVSQGIVIADPNVPGHPIVYANPAFSTITGYAEDDVIGRDSGLLEGPESDVETLRALRRAIASGEAHAVEILHYRKDRTPFWDAISTTPVRDDHGALTHHLTVHADVTERRRLEESLRQAQRMELMGRLAGGVAHDFNNLLTIINGNSEALLQLPLGEEPAELVHEIGRAGQRATTLTHPLLAFSRRQVLRPQVLNMNLVAAELGVMLHRLIKGDIEIRTRIEATTPFILADLGHVEQVIINLAINARDAMLDGGTLTIATADVDVEHDPQRSILLALGHDAFLKLEVIDTGSGMDATTRAGAFEPFFTMKAVGQGTGLGLSTVYGIVKQSEGHISVDSTLGRGSAFSVYFPTVAAPPSERRPQVATGLPRRGTESILVVEDEPSILALIRRALSQNGYTVHDGSNGVEALRIVSDPAIGIDLLLTDDIMPGMGGRTLAERARVERPALTVMFMSGYPDDESLREDLGHAATSFLSKPFATTELASKVREALDQRANRRQSAP
ncbi:MAG: PAS domain-containing protein [Gemmatimonadaceae bacterium]|nr:PAS domain-containing protein [Gemmatimonadaceae bacterium]